ncbi:MAG: hypothetical protein HRU06_20435 [Oceanospirillaceae bacterium]|nr:hypothetical protein [Oceanospirillaceae bacterium]
MSKLDFSNINKTTTQSFKAQRNLIKKMAKGEQVLCEHCHQPLTLNAPMANNKDIQTGICCKKGCTDIQLEFA